jgi:hypothetical protein
MSVPIRGSIIPPIKWFVLASARIAVSRLGLYLFRDNEACAYNSFVSQSLRANTKSGLWIIPIAIVDVMAKASPMYLYQHDAVSSNRSTQAEILTMIVATLSDALVLHHICAQLAVFVIELVARNVIWHFRACALRRLGMQRLMVASLSARDSGDSARPLIAVVCSAENAFNCPQGASSELESSAESRFRPLP